MSPEHTNEALRQLLVEQKNQNKDLQEHLTRVRGLDQDCDKLRQQKIELK